MPEQLSDAMLLERFVSFREEAAFGVLVERHGPLVERICRRVLRNEHDVEDVFQATFLVLARRASGVLWRESVAGWLGAVAHRLALGARSDLIRQKRRETPISTLAVGRSARTGSLDPGLPERFHPLAEPFVEIERKEVGRLIDEELLLLPEKYRSPVVLCYFEGRTHEEAAHQLGWPAGSMSRRLRRAQAILRRRLIHRGFSLASLLLAVAFAVVSAWIMCSDHSRNAAAVRSAMASLEPLTAQAGGLESAIERIDRDGSVREREQIKAMARRATQAAAEIEGYEPNKQPDQWREYSSEMKLSAALLAQAASENDRSSMLLAARRLNSSCLGCHEAFCQTAPASAAGVGSILPQALTTSQPLRNRVLSWFIFEEISSLPEDGFDPQTDGAMEVALLTAQ